jgi:hypothetical protein
MLLRFNAPALTSNTARGILYHGLLVLLTLSLLAGTLAAQSDQETKTQRAKAKRLPGEGSRLYKEGSSDLTCQNVGSVIETGASSANGPRQNKSFEEVEVAQPDNVQRHRVYYLREPKIEPFVVGTARVNK